MLDRLAVIETIWTKLRADRVMWEPYVQAALKVPVSQYHWTPRQGDDAIKLLGKKLRRAMSRRSVD